MATTKRLCSLVSLTYKKGLFLIVNAMRSVPFGKEENLYPDYGLRLNPPPRPHIGAGARDSRISVNIVE